MAQIPVTKIERTNIRIKRPTLQGMVKELKAPVKIPGLARAPKIKEAVGQKSYKVRAPKV